MHHQHAKAFSFMTVQMLVMHFMRPADRPYISIPAFGKPFETLMGDHIMHQEISRPIRHDTKTDRLHPPNKIKCTKKYQQKTGHSKDDKEPIILFKKTRFLL